MSVFPYGEFPSQQSSSKVQPSKGVSQFKTPLRRESGVQSGKQLAQGTGSARGTTRTAGSISSRGVSQFKTLSIRYTASDPITEKTGVLPIYRKNVSTDPYIGIPVPLSPLGAQVQRQSPQFLRESDRSWRPALPGIEARVRPEALHRTKTHVTMKVILMVGIALLVGGSASFLLLRFPTYLAVAWVILIIVFSNLISRELRSYYQPTPTTPGMEAVDPSTSSTPDDVDMGRHPALENTGNTTGYLKALCVVFKNDQPAQTFPLER